MKKKAVSTKNLVMYAVLTAIVFVLQFVSMQIRFGIFSITLSLFPIAIGAALGGKKIGAWLGFIFSIAVLISGDANPFLAISVFGTITTVIAKGTLAGFVTGLVFELLSKKQIKFAVSISAVLSPIVNTGVFIIGCLVFFTASEIWAGGIGAVFKYILGFISINFFIEMAINIILAPTIVRLLKIKKYN